MYSSDVIEEVVSRNDIVDVISNDVRLKRSGSSYDMPAFKVKFVDSKTYIADMAKGTTVGQ